MDSPKTGKNKSTKAGQETLKLTIDSLDDNGIGLARHGERTALVQGAFPGETVIAAVEHSGRSHIYTRLRKVLRQSPQRTAQTHCALEQDCLGCPLISLQYAAQLAFKQERVSQALQEQNLSALAVPAVSASDPPFGYRASAKLAITRQRGRVSIGLYRRGSHAVVNCSECPVHHPLINRITTLVSAAVQRQNISVYNANRRRGALRYLLVRVSPTNGKALVTFVSGFRDQQQLPKLAKWLMRKVPEIIGVHQNINASSGNVILGRETMKLLGQPDLIEQIGDIRLRMAPESFFQVNTLQAARIYALVREWAALKRTDSVIDLYCGIGGIALHLARDAGRVSGIEYSRQAVRNATENAALNQLTNCHFIAGDATEELLKLQLKEARPTLITLNPPRKGCPEDLLQHICRLPPNKIIYLSCDPKSLARDLRFLVDHGYRIERLQPVDMFPQTAHIETLVELRKAG